MTRINRYTKEVVDEYVKAGYWTTELTVDFWDRNAVLYPDEEALVDSKTRLTWLEAKEQIEGIAFRLLELGFKRSVDLVLIRLAVRKPEFC